MGGNSIPGGLEKEDRQDDQSEFVDSIIDKNNDDSNVLISFSTGSRFDPAKEEKLGRNLYNRAVRLEQQSKFLRGLGKLGVGTNRIEANQAKSRSEMIVDTGRRVKDIKDELRIKFKDAERAATAARIERDHYRKRVESSSGAGKNVVRKMVARLQSAAGSLREEISVKNKKSLEFKVKKWEIVPVRTIFTTNTTW